MNQLHRQERWKIFTMLLGFLLWQWCGDMVTASFSTAVILFHALEIKYFMPISYKNATQIKFLSHYSNELVIFSLKSPLFSFSLD